MKIAFYFFILGLLSGALYGVLKFVVFIFKNNIVIQIISDLIYSLGVGSCFVIATNQYMYGEIRAYIVAIFILGIYLERKTLGKLFAKPYLMLYNGARKSILSLKDTKLGKIIFK